MKKMVSKLMAALLLLSACAPGGNGPSTPITPKASNSSDIYSHNVSDDNTFANGKPSPPAKISNSGSPYTIGGDERVVKEVETQRPDPQAPLTPAQEQELLFSDSLDDFKLFRYDDAARKDLKRFGKTTFEFHLRIKTTNGNHSVVIFKGNLQGSGNNFEFTNVTADKRGFKLTGQITDDTDSSTGKFEVENEGRRAKIFYRAFKAYINVFTKTKQDWSKIQNLKKKIDRFKAAADDKSLYAWGQNMVVAGITVGVSRFHYDILRFVDPKKPFNKSEELADFSLDGSSIKTGRVTAPPVTVETNKDSNIEKVEMEGDGDDEDSRIFSATVKDKNEKAEIMFDIQRASSSTPAGGAAASSRPPVIIAPKPELEAPDAIDDEWTLPDIDESKVAPMTPVTQPTTPAKPKPNMSKPSKPGVQPTPPVSTPSRPPVEKPRPAVASPENYVGIGQNAFFYTNYNNPSLPRTKKVIDAFERNRDVRQVIAAMSEVSGKMRRFFYYAKPFVPVIESIAEAYDMPPAFSLMIVSESEYFSGPFKTKSRSYPAYSFLNPKSTSAIGPFQFIAETARRNQMDNEMNGKGQPVSSADERNYFAPSACAAALFLSKISDMFQDPTLGIMAYFRGEGAILGVVRAKMKRYSEFPINYATIARNHMVPNEWINYVARILAGYFISGEPAKYPSYDKQKQIITNPLTIDQIKNATKKPTVRSQKCQGAISKALTS